MPPDSMSEPMLAPGIGVEERFFLGAAQFELQTLRVHEESPVTLATAALARGSGAVAWRTGPGPFLEIQCSPSLARRVGLSGGEHVHSFGWTDDELLVVLGCSGQLRVFEANGAEVLALSLKTEFKVEEEVTVERLLLASDACVALTGQGKSLVIEGLSQLDTSPPVTYELPCTDELSKHRVLCCAVSMVEGLLRVLLVLDDTCLIVCDRFYVDRVDLSALHSITPPLAMAVSPSGGFTACCNLHALTILNATYDTKVRVHHTFLGTRLTATP